jgi:hypothetical protein
MKSILGSWKTTLAGLVAGAPIAIDAVVKAYAAGAFTGASGAQLFLGIGLVVLGAVSKDHNVTGGTVSNGLVAPNDVVVTPPKP